MGKRSNFERRRNDAYDTPLSAVLPLLPHLEEGTRFVEPCAGKGDLVRHLEAYGHHCMGAFDIEPRDEAVHQRDAMKFRADKHHYDFDVFITNPPWTRELLHPMIVWLWWQKPTWLLFDADWAHTSDPGARPYLPMVRKIVSVGRVKWIAGSQNQGYDNAAWYLFAPVEGAEPQFFGRK